MNRQLLAWLAFGLLLGALFGFAAGKGDSRAPVIVGALGAVLSAIGFCVAHLAHKAWHSDTGVTNYFAVVGLLVGAICGGVLGARSMFGHFMISIFNPDLPARDFQGLFGAIGGIVLGAVAGVLGGAAFKPFVQRRKAEPNDAADSR